MIDNETSSPLPFRSQSDDESDVDSSGFMPKYQLGKLGDHPHLRQAWSDDESTISSSKFIRKPRSPRRQISVDDSTIASTQSGREDDFSSSFSDWLNYTNKITDLVSKQIQGCTHGTGDDCDDNNFKLKDEEFFWNPSAQSFDTLDTTRTTEVTKESFSKWKQNISMWQSDRNAFTINENHSEEFGKRRTSM